MFTGSASTSLTAQSPEVLSARKMWPLWGCGPQTDLGILIFQGLGHKDSAESFILICKKSTN